MLIGTKWKLLIMRNLLSRPWRFNELKQNSERIIQKVLTDSLRSMEAVGIITPYIPRYRRGWNMRSPSWASPCVRS